MVTLDRYRQVFAGELPLLHMLAFFATGNREAAFDHLYKFAALPLAATVLAAPDPGVALLGALGRHIEVVLGRKAEGSFHILDNTLRDDITQPIDLEVPGLDGDSQNVQPLLQELKRTCLAGVLLCLPPAVRVAFILTHILNMGPALGAEMVGTTESAYRVRLTRARHRLDNYLAPRCQHLDRQNPCTCEGRLAIALTRRFVSPPPHSDVRWHERHDANTYLSTSDLYQELPTVALSAEQRQELLARCVAPTVEMGVAHV